MSAKTFGIIALIGAPFLFIDTAYNGFSIDQHSSLSGLFNLIYITAWICSIIGLRRIGAFGSDKFSSIIFIVQIIFLCLANCWNLYELIRPGAGTLLYRVLDAFWPLSNLCMLITGIAILFKGGLRGWKRYIPLLAGCWLPMGLVLWSLIGRNKAVLLTVNIYSAVLWSIMALLILTSLTNEEGGRELSEAIV